MRAFNWILIALSALENVKISEFVSFRSYRATSIGSAFTRSLLKSQFRFSDTKLVGFCFPKPSKTKTGLLMKTNACVKLSKR